MLIPPVEAQIRVNHNYNQVPSAPLPITAYLGVYVPSGPLEHSLELLHISNVSNVMVLDSGRSVLNFVGIEEENGGTTHIFRMMPWPGEAFGPASSSCSKTQMSDWYELLKFDIRTADSKATSISFDYVFGNKWLRT